MQRSSQTLNDRLDNAARYINQVAKEVGQMNELGQSMRDLQVLLQSPKLRGNIGEQVLKDLIAQSFPKGSFHLQYAFRSGDKVDAAITTSAGILPIDSKFPLENFRKMTTAGTRAERSEAKRSLAGTLKSISRRLLKIYPARRRHFGLGDYVYSVRSGLPRDCRYPGALRIRQISADLSGLS